MFVSESTEMSSSFSGLEITLFYGGVQFVLLLILAISIHFNAKKQGEDLSCHKFFRRLWDLRGIYTPLVVHIYDTATGMCTIKQLRDIFTHDTIDIYIIQ